MEILIGQYTTAQSVVSLGIQTDALITIDDVLKNTYFRQISEKGRTRSYSCIDDIENKKGSITTVNIIFYYKCKEKTVNYNLF